MKQEQLEKYKFKKNIFHFFLDAKKKNPDLKKKK